ncbi:pantetheine-phosphate adenylyltransferase [Catenisphaera adipataccumulans]|jgi:pantetheine-phosphate adenylyltransferase|uniref:Phosphopantetheine adenylyltransferase n=1 Tax=Catenisphaera adipataccumulans TaxID=700500 RepID=A0A7W8CY04_9FIRM|nr:pantetheine-phosphate adenylyltransferase [Catenisphaera adipataccumulans]MBB5182030.1 pantetheine-phosphate adenylyltransferase [Catenisphaera adipataccumulans]
MRKAAFCGTFDPITLGHLDVIKRASRIFEEVVVFVAPNSLKNQMFSEAQRRQWIEEACADLDNVTVRVQHGLTADACRQAGVHVLIRGIRNENDFSYEQNMDFMNHEIDENLDTICFFTRPEYQYCSSSNVKELLKYHQDISHFVPDCVWKGVKNNENFD